MDDGLPADGWTSLTSGFSNEVARRGDQVRRRTGPWSPAVHELLDWLHARGFSRMPRRLEADGEVEVLTYLEGQPVFRPWSPEARTNAWMHELGVWLREYHGAGRISAHRPATASPGARSGRRPT